VLHCGNTLYWFSPGTCDQPVPIVPNLPSVSLDNVMVSNQQRQGSLTRLEVRTCRLQFGKLRSTRAHIRADMRLAKCNSRKERHDPLALQPEHLIDHGGQAAFGMLCFQKSSRSWGLTREGLSSDGRPWGHINGPRGTSFVGPIATIASFCNTHPRLPYV